MKIIHPSTTSIRNRPAWNFLTLAVGRVAWMDVSGRFVLGAPEKNTTARMAHTENGTFDVSIYTVNMSYVL